MQNSTNKQNKNYQISQAEFKRIGQNFEKLSF